MTDDRIPFTSHWIERTRNVNSVVDGDRKFSEGQSQAGVVAWKGVVVVEQVGIEQEEVLVSFWGDGHAFGLEW